MRDATQGRLLLILSVLTMIAYFWALFLSDPLKDPFLGRPVREWALIIPVLIFVFLFLFVVAWIGWAMATTPPPLSATGKDSKEKEEKKKEEAA